MRPGGIPRANEGPYVPAAIGQQRAHDAEGAQAQLTAQAHTLDALFNDLTRLAYCTWDNLNVAERLLRLAYKVQSRSRATLQIVGVSKNPALVTARQTNGAHGKFNPSQPN